MQVAQGTLSTEDAGSTLARVAAGELERWVLPWLPLWRGAAEAANMAEWQRLAALEADWHSHSDFGALAVVFAELAGTAALWRQALARWDMRESPQVLEWQREARMETRKEDVRRVVQLRFTAPIPADLAEQLAALQSAEELDRWLAACATAPSLDAFRAAVRNGKRKRKRST